MKKELEQKLLVKYPFLRPKQNPETLKSNLRIIAHEYYEKNKNELAKTEKDLRDIEKSRINSEKDIYRNLLKLNLSLKKDSEEYNPNKDKKFVPITDLLVFGLGVKDGWYYLLDVLCDEIQKELNKTNQSIEVRQIKEKFGTLSFYYKDSNNNSNIFKLVRNAEILSGKICETCGANGQTLKINSWFNTVCPKHEEAMRYSDWYLHRDYAELAEENERFAKADIRQFLLSNKIERKIIHAT